MKALLGSWGAEVIASFDGDDVVARVHDAGRMPDAIISDYRLAGGRVGTDVIARLHRELDPSIPAVMVTGSTTPERFHESARLGYDLMLKPVVPEKLRSLIALKFRSAHSV